jgi:hypothetical protein
MLVHMVQAPKHRPTNDPACWVGLGRRSRSARRPLAQPPMGTPRIEVGDVFVLDALQMPLVDDQHLIQTLVLHRSDPPLGERVRSRRLQGCPELCYPESSQTPIKRFAIPAVPVTDEIPRRIPIPATGVLAAAKDKDLGRKDRIPV